MKPWMRAIVQGAACGLMLGLVLLIGGRLWQPQVAAAQAKQPAVPDVVKARRFEVVDAAGKTRVTLSVLPDGSPVLVLCDAAGKPRVTLSVLPDGSPGLRLSDAAGKTRANLSLLPDGTPGLDLSDAAGKTRAVVAVLPDGGPNLILFDAAGETRTIVSLTKDNAPYLELWDKNGNARAILGAASLSVTETEEVRMRPESSLVLFDKGGKVIWKAP